MSDFTIDTSLPADAREEEVRLAHRAALAEINSRTVECRVCGVELLDNPSDLVEHSKETGHAAF